MKLLLLFCFLFSCISAQDLRPSRFYWASVGALAGGSAFDTVTSAQLNSTPGVHESNPFLSDSHGKFALSRGVTLKCLVFGATVAGQRAVMYFARKRGSDTRKIEKTFAWMNLSLGTGYTGIATRNLTLR